MHRPKEPSVRAANLLLTDCWPRVEKRALKPGSTDLQPSAAMATFDTQLCQ